MNYSFWTEFKVFGFRHMIALVILWMIKNAEKKHKEDLLILRKAEYDVRDHFDLLNEYM